MRPLVVHAWNLFPRFVLPADFSTYCLLLTLFSLFSPFPAVSDTDHILYLSYLDERALQNSADYYGVVVVLTVLRSGARRSGAERVLAAETRSGRVPVVAVKDAPSEDDDSDSEQGADLDQDDRSSAAVAAASRGEDGAEEHTGDEGETEDDEDSDESKDVARPKLSRGSPSRVLTRSGGGPQRARSARMREASDPNSSLPSPKRRKIPAPSSSLAPPVDAMFAVPIDLTSSELEKDIRDWGTAQWEKAKAARVNALKEADDHERRLLSISTDIWGRPLGLEVIARSEAEARALSASLGPSYRIVRQFKTRNEVLAERARKRESSQVVEAQQLEQRRKAGKVIRNSIRMKKLHMERQASDRRARQQALRAKARAQMEAELARQARKEAAEAARIARQEAKKEERDRQRRETKRETDREAAIDELKTVEAQIRTDFAEFTSQALADASSNVYKDRMVLEKKRDELSARVIRLGGGLKAAGGVRHHPSLGDKSPPAIPLSCEVGLRRGFFICILHSCCLRCCLPDLAQFPTHPDLSADSHPRRGPGGARPQGHGCSD